MSSEPSQTHLETLHPILEKAIAEADLFLTSLEEQIKRGGFKTQAKTEIMPSNEQPIP